MVYQKFTLQIYCRKLTFKFQDFGKLWHFLKIMRKKLKMEMNICACQNASWQPAVARKFADHKNDEKPVTV